MPWLDTYHIPFSWSHSRATLCAECRRKYYWRYYAPYGGNSPWETGDRALIYTLGRLTTLPMLIGAITHDVARESLRSAQAGRAWLPTIYAASARSLLDAGLRRSEKAARSLRGSARRVTTPGKGAVLLEAHYYGEPLSSADRDAALTDVARYVEGMRDHPLYQRMMRDASSLLVVDQRDTFEIDGALVYAAPDAVLREGDGRLWLVDWKTGQTVATHHERYTRQLLVYALFACRKWNATARSVECRIADVGTGESLAVPVDDAALGQAERDIAASIAALRAALRDPMRNIAHAAEFPLLTPTAEEAARDAPPAACRRCAYRLLCGRERDHETMTR